MNNHLARLFENRHFARFRYAHFIFPFDDVNVKLAEANRALRCSQIRQACRRISDHAIGQCS
jgi:hypothetical protein